jgi:hypothetical protein
VRPGCGELVYPIDHAAGDVTGDDDLDGVDLAWDLEIRRDLDEHRRLVRAARRKRQKEDEAERRKEASG